MKALLLLLSLNLQAQVWEKIEIDTVHFYPVFMYSIQSYVQLPGDSLEYQKIGIHVQIKPKVEHEDKKRSVRGRKTAKSALVPQTWVRNAYLGTYLKPSGRKFKTLIGNEVLGIENKNLTMMDKLLNAENNFE